MRFTANAVTALSPHCDCIVMAQLLGSSLSHPAYGSSAMTALCLDLVLEDHCGRDLHEWLGGDWALLFSNPEDFEPQGREKERWLVNLREQLGMRGARALAVKRDDGSTHSSWSSKSGLNPRPVQLREPSFAAADGVSFAARALRGELLTLQSRFVLLIDGSLKRRAALKYSAGRCAASVLDLLSAVDALRRRRPLVKAA
jgi:glutaredoxin/glutathione-dependent peroxiredoxin